MVIEALACDYILLSGSYFSGFEPYFEMDDLLRAQMTFFGTITVLLLVSDAAR